MTKPKLVDDGYILIEPEFFTLDELVERFLWKQSTNQNYKNIACRISGKRSIFGSWLYTKRKKNARGASGYEYRVIPDSMDPRRIDLVNAALEYLYGINIADSSKSVLVREMESFIDWLNMTETQLPVDIQQAKQLYREYTKYLQQIVKTHDPRKAKSNGFGSASAHDKQKVAGNLLCTMLNVELEIIRGMTPSIVQGYSRKESADVDLDEPSIDESLSYSFQFFEQVADFCLNAKPYPHKIALLEHEALLVPEPHANVPVMTPFTGTAGYAVKGRYWDMDKGSLRNEAEVQASVMASDTYQAYSQGHQNSFIKRALNKLKRRKAVLEAANSDPCHKYRLDLAAKAMKAYFFVLLDITGMNDSTLATVEWNEDGFVEEVAEKGLKNIKRRAGNKAVVFKIQSIFMGSFRTFIRLRRFVLNGHECNTLFFTGVGEHARLSASAATGGFGAMSYDVIRALYPNLAYTGSQTLRLNKKRWLMKKSKGQTFLVAVMMQHKPETGGRYYPHETRAESQDMMGEYLDYQHRIIMEMDESNLSSAGGCDSPENVPQSDADGLWIKPDCQKKMTCLFCTHYRIKAVEEEIRKVLSMEYVINRHSILHARSQVHFDTVMGPILERIKLLFKSMENKFPKTQGVIAEVRHDVYENQNLHWYWQARLELLWELGWV